MQSVQDTCSHILLLNKGEKLADSSFSELQKKYQSKKFIVRYRGLKLPLQMPYGRILSS